MGLLISVDYIVLWFPTAKKNNLPTILLEDLTLSRDSQVYITFASESSLIIVAIL